MPVGEGVGAERRLQRAAVRAERHLGAEPVPGIDESLPRVAVGARQRMLVAPAGPGAVGGLGQEGEAEVLPRLREHGSADLPGAGA